jgi:hypothetical protein
LPKPPDLLLPRRRGATWWALLASVAVHVVLLSIRATDWFWSGGIPPQAEVIPIVVDIPQVEMRLEQPERRPRPRPTPPAPVEEPVAREAQAPPAEVAAAEPGGLPGLPPDTSARGEPARTGVRPGIPRLRPSRGEGTLWVQPLPLAPRELAQRLTRTHIELLDSAVTAIVQNYLDSLLAAPTPYDAKPPSWTTTIGGKTFGIDQRNIYLGGFKLPTALLALLPIPAVNNVDLRDAQQLSDMRSDLLHAAQRAATMEEFKQAIRDLRERRQRELDFERNQRRAASDTTRKP